jgi:hypothetical protein
MDIRSFQMCNARDQIGRFFGTFAVARTIQDRLSGEIVRFDGTATLERRSDGVGAKYAELGEMVQPSGVRFHAERSYLWHEDAGRIWVRFADGRDFHDFDPKIGGLASAHLCGADLYRGGYELSDWPRWSVTWDVSGPRKDYCSITTYVPVE